MSRSISVARLMYNHITWIGDALVVELLKHKGDQEGENAYPKSSRDSCSVQMRRTFYDQRVSPGGLVYR